MKQLGTVALDHMAPGYNTFLPATYQCSPLPGLFKSQISLSHLKSCMG